MRSAFNHKNDLSERCPFTILEHIEKLFINLTFLDSKVGVVGLREAKNWDEGYVGSYRGNFNGAARGLHRGLQALKDTHPE